MRKKLLYAGALLFLIGMAFAFMSFLSMNSLLATGGIPPGVNLSLSANAVGYVPISLNQSGLLRLLYNSSNAVDFYLANQSAFAGLRGAKGAGLRGAASGLEGKGVFAVYENSTNELFPYAYANGTAPAYIANMSVLPAGTYYAIFGNDGSGTANIMMRYIVISGTAELSMMVYGGISVLLLASGLIIAIVSLFLKEKAEEVRKAEAIDEEVKREYERIERKGRKGSLGRPTKPGRRKSKNR
jgi:hypothetical protein